MEIPGLARGIRSEHLEDVACGLCGSRERELQFTDEPFSVVRCTVAASWLSGTVPPASSAAYPLAAPFSAVRWMPGAICVSGTWPAPSSAA